MTHRVKKPIRIERSIAEIKAEIDRIEVELRNQKMTPTRAVALTQYQAALRWVVGLPDPFDNDTQTHLRSKHD